MSQKRYIPHDSNVPSDLASLKDEVIRAIQAGVKRVKRHPSSKSSVYIGAGGHLVINWKLADMLPALGVDGGEVDITTFPLDPPQSGSRASFLETSVGTATLILAQHLRKAADATAAKAKDAAALLEDAVRIALDEEFDDDGCEVLYGRAGLLYSLLFLRARTKSLRGTDRAPDSPMTTLNRLTSSQTIHPLVDDIVARGKHGTKAYADELQDQERQLVPSLMWSWHGKRYLGAAHGAAGILQMLLRAPKKVVAPHWDDILNTVEWFISVQQPSSNWPHKASRHMHDPVDDELVQWCHGAPGVVILLSTLLQRYGAHSRSDSPAVPVPIAETARASLARGGQLVYEHGVLRKGVGLCHGVAGSVYTLLGVSDALDAEPHGEWFLRAAHLAQLACAYETLASEGQMGTPDRPYSLYEGVAGMCCAWAEVLDRLTGQSSTLRKISCGMPGYDDLA